MKTWKDWLKTIALAALVVLPCVGWAKQMLREGSREPLGSVDWPTGGGMRVTLTVQRLPGQSDEEYAACVRPLVEAFLREFPLQRE